VGSLNAAPSRVTLKGIHGGSDPRWVVVSLGMRTLLDGIVISAPPGVYHTLLFLSNGDCDVVLVLRVVPDAATSWFPRTVISRLPFPLPSSKLIDLSGLI